MPIDLLFIIYDFELILCNFDKFLLPNRDPYNIKNSQRAVREKSERPEV